MSDLFARTQAEFQRHQGEFLHLEMEACTRNAELASTMFHNGSSKFAERTMAEAEGAYAVLVRSISDPNQTKGLTIKARQEIAGKMKGLRQKIEALQRRRDRTSLVA